jgi:hypothetical protein
MNAREWPPLVRGENLPAWVRVRDVAITVAAWALLLYWMRGALLLIADWLAPPMFELTRYPEPDWPRIWLVLSPFLAAAAVLAAWLYYWSIRRRRILRHGVESEQPAPLDLRAHAAQFGVAPEAVAAFRGLRIATVRFDAASRLDLQDIR